METVDGFASTSATVTVTSKASSIEFTKTVWIADLPAPCGITNTLCIPVTTTVAYCYTLYNNGIITLTHHTLADDQLGTLLAGRAYTLTPGATYTTIVTQTIAVTTTNVATWTAAALRFTPVEPPTATAVATVTLSTSTIRVHSLSLFLACIRCTNLRPIPSKDFGKPAIDSGNVRDHDDLTI